MLRANDVRSRVGLDATGDPRQVVELVVVYAAVAYAVSWACWLPLAWADRVVLVGGWPTHMPGLVGPAVSAFVVSFAFGGRAPATRLVGRVLRWRIGWWWLVALSPLTLVVGDVVARAATGHLRPALREFGEMNGLPQWSVVGVGVLLIVAGLGEETGWRGFLQSVLQRRMRPLLAVLVVAAIWAGWHAPLFLIIESYRGFTPGTLVGFVIGLACGAVVLGWLYNRTGSVLAAGVWHATYNLTAATAAAHGLLAAVSTTVVIMAAFGLVLADLLTRGRVLAPAIAARA
jgi:membrane protease YdiL (CAAX protease family)